MRIHEITKPDLSEGILDSVKNGVKNALGSAVPKAKKIGQQASAMAGAAQAKKLGNKALAATGSAIKGAAQKIAPVTRATATRAYNAGVNRGQGQGGVMRGVKQAVKALSSPQAAASSQQDLINKQAQAQAQKLSKLGYKIDTKTQPVTYKQAMTAAKAGQRSTSAYTQQGAVQQLKQAGLNVNTINDLIQAAASGKINKDVVNKALGFK